MRNLPEITGMRGVAALLVVGFHGIAFYLMAGGQFRDDVSTRVFTAGWIGVDFFLVLSAFLLALPLLHGATRVRDSAFWKTYLAKRWLRIGPAYLVSILVTLRVLGGLTYLRTGTLDLILHALYLHSLDFQSFTSIQGPYWSLAIEFQFYLILPVFVLLFSRRLWPWTTAACVLFSIAWRTVTYDPSDLMRTFWLGGQVPGFLGHFALGIAAARLYLDGQARATVRAYGAWVIAGCFLAVPLLFFHDGFIGFPTMSLGLVSNASLRTLLAVGFAALVLVVASRDGIVRSTFASWPLETVGKMSYSIYLMHVPLGHLLIPYIKPAAAYGFGPFAAVLLASTVVTSAVFYLLVERPSLWLKVRGAARAARARSPQLRADTPTIVAPPERAPALASPTEA